MDGGELLPSEKYTMTLNGQMNEWLKKEKMRRCLSSIPETIRAILSEYIAGQNPPRSNIQ
jgi:hypothetical protein